MLGILVTWWPVFALLYVPQLAQALAIAFWKRTRSRLDHQIPDELPMTAGEWLADRLAQLGHPIGAIVSDQPRNACHPDDQLIQLSDETHFTRIRRGRTGSRRSPSSATCRCSSRSGSRDRRRP